MTKIVLFVFLIVNFSLVNSETLSLPSRDFAEIYQGDKVSSFLGSDESIENFLYIVWDLARQEKVDNRAYLFSLAIDLYHSLPPSEDPIGFNPGEIGGKGAWRQKILSAINYLGSSPQQSWERTSRQGKSLWGKELAYIYHYLRENVTLDDYKEAASIDPRVFGLENPTYYATMRSYMEKMQPAIEADVAPWDAEKYLASDAAKEKPTANQSQTTTAPQYTQNPTPAAQATSSPDTSEAEYRRTIFIIALILIGLAIIGYIFGRSRKKK